ncbi:hypothetical protein CB1_000314015 [Camelus ferus]|nr:hypothetical protein CB1_000314015 [Camelus ferus]
MGGPVEEFGQEKTTEPCYPYCSDLFLGNGASADRYTVLNVQQEFPTESAETQLRSSWQHSATRLRVPRQQSQEGPALITCSAHPFSSRQGSQALGALLVLQELRNHSRSYGIVTVTVLSQVKV